MKAREQRSRARSVKAFVVIENANPQTRTPKCKKAAKFPTAGTVKLQGKKRSCQVANETEWAKWEEDTYPPSHFSSSFLPCPGVIRGILL
jgi:hypothetical protein